MKAASRSCESEGLKKLTGIVGLMLSAIRWETEVTCRPRSLGRQTARVSPSVVRKSEYSMMVFFTPTCSTRTNWPLSWAKNHFSSNPPACAMPRTEKAYFCSADRLCQIREQGLLGKIMTRPHWQTTLRPGGRE